MGWITDLLKEYPALSVAKERLALAQEKYDALEAENKELKNQVETLENENAALKEQLSGLQPKGEGILEDIEIEILKLLGSGYGLELPAGVIAQRLNISVPKAEYYLQRLNENEYVYFPIIMGQEPEYSLDQKGREFLVRNDLI